MANWTEDFTGSNGDPPDSNDWNETDPDGKLSIQSNKLNFNSSDAAAQASYIDSKFYVNGDFDIIIDFDISSLTTPSTAGSYFRIRVSTGSLSSIIYMHKSTGGAQSYAVYGTQTAWTVASTSDTSGKFRLTRSGSTIKGYYWSGSQWVWNGSSSGFTFTESHDDDVYLTLTFSKGGSGSLNANLDNLDVTADSIYWGEQLEDFSLGLAAYHQKLDVLEMILQAHDGLEYRDLSMILEAISNITLKDFSMLLKTLGLKKDSLKMILELSKNKFRDLALLLSVTDGVVLNDLSMILSVTDGTIFNSFKMDLKAIKATPAFRSVNAHRVSSVVHEVS